MKLHITITVLLLMFAADFAGLKAQSLMYEWGEKKSIFGVLRAPNTAVKRIATDADGNIYELLDINWGIDIETPIDTTRYFSSNGNCVLIKYNPSGQILWVKQIGGELLEIQYTDGHLYYTGIYPRNQDISFDSSVDTLVHNAFYDCFVAKMDTAANLIWANGICGTAMEYISSLDVANNGDVYIAIQSDLDSNLNISPNGTPVYVDTRNETQIFAKYNSNGQYLWHTQLPSTIANLTINEHNSNLYVSYNVLDTTTISGIVLNPISNIYPSIGVSRINNSNGNIVWSKCVGVSQHRQTKNIINAQGDVTVFFYAPQTFSPIDYDPSANIFMMNHVGNFEFANVKFDKLGNFITAGAFSTVTGENWHGVATDADDNIYIMGVTGFEDSTDIDLTTAVQNVPVSQATNFYLLKYADNNTLLYYEKSDLGTIGNPRLHVDNNNNIYTSGLFVPYVDMDLTAGIDSVHITTSPLQNQGHFLVKYNQNGVVGVERQVVEAVKIYPNPATDKVIISQARIGETLQIIDVMGRVISRQFVYSQEFEINTNHLCNGVYFFQIGSQTHKIVIAK